MNSTFNLDSAFRSLFNLSHLRLYTFVPEFLCHNQQRSPVPRTTKMVNNNSSNFDFNRVATLEASLATLQNSQNDLLTKFEATTAKLERELDDQKAARKNVEKELQRSRLAEKIARDALTQLRSTQIMSQDATGSKEKANTLKKEQPEASKDAPVEMSRDGYTWVEDKYIQEMVKRLETLEKHKGAVEEQMRIFQKRLKDGDARLKDSKTRNEEQREDLREMHTEIQKAHKKIGELQDQLHHADQKHQQVLDAAAHDAKVELDTAHASLNTHKDRIDELKKELRQKTTEVSTATNELVKAEKDKGKLQQEAKEWTEKTTYLTEVNKALLEDVNKSNSHNEAVDHEHDELKVSLAEAENALADITAAEAASRGSHTLLAKKVQESAGITAEDNESLQKNIDDFLSQVGELQRELAMKDYTISRKDKKIRDLMKEDYNRPLATPQESFFGLSLADELGATDFEEQSSETDDERSEPEPAALQLSAVSDLSSAPVPSPTPQLSAVTSVSTVPVGGAPAVSSPSRRRSPFFATIAATLYLYLQVSSKLQAWECANGVSFGEGYGGKFAYDGAFKGYN